MHATSFTNKSGKNSGSLGIFHKIIGLVNIYIYIYILDLHP